MGGSWRVQCLKIRSMRRLALLSVLLVVACDTSVVAKDYNQTCLADADCAVVVEGEFCVDCGPVTSAAAINVADLPRYQRERDAIQKAGCPPRLGPPRPCVPPQSQELPAVQLQAVCNAGSCEVRTR